MSRFVGVRKFLGKDLADVLRFLRVDLGKSMDDLFTVIRNATLFNTYKEKLYETPQSLPASGTTFEVFSIDLEPGDWDLVGTMYVNWSGIVMTGYEAWISDESLSVVGAILGYSHAVADFTRSARTLIVHRRVQNTEPVRLYMCAYATYGTGSPTYQASLIARGYGKGVNTI